MNKLKQSFLSGLIFSGTIMLSFLAYGAWNNLSHVESTDTLTDTRWNEMVDRINELGNSKIPTGMVSAFYGENCPAGWTKADGSGDEKKTDGTLGNLDLRGEFIRGWDNGRGVDINRGVSSFQTGTLLPHVYTHRVSSTVGILVSPPITSYGGDNIGLNSIGVDTSISVPSGQYFSTSLSPSGGFNSTYFTTRPRNVALLYCVKN